MWVTITENIVLTINEIEMILTNEETNGCYIHMKSGKHVECPFTVQEVLGKISPTYHGQGGTAEAL